jgi:hypothetical protein
MTAFLICTALVAAFLSKTVGAAAPDWLVVNVTTPVAITAAGGVITMDNGLIRRQFNTAPYCTLDYYSYTREASLLRAVSAEAYVQVLLQFDEVGPCVNMIASCAVGRCDVRHR